MKARALVRLYPRAWRERYGEEFAELVASQKLGPRMWLDIVFGALDARLAPQPQVAAPAKGAAGGRIMQALRSGCAAPAASRAEQIRLALWIAAVIVGIALFYVWLKRTVGDNVWIEALGNSVVSFGAIAYMQLLLRQYRLRTRVAFTAVMLVAVYLIGLFAAWT